MTIGIILIVAILVLGGVLATLGDRIGTKVGKARLSLFNLRPKNTAVLITIVTGVLISGSTLGILFATSKPLRRGIFEYDETQRNLRKAREEINEARQEKAQIENELIQARTEQADAQGRLNETNKALERVLAQRAETEEQLEETQEQLNRVESDFEQTQQEIANLSSKFQQAQGRLQTVTNQAEDLRQEIAQLQSDRQTLIQQRDAVREQITQRDQEIAQRNQEIAQRDQEIAQRNAEIAQRDQEIIARNQALEERDQEIAIRTEAIAQRETRLKELEEQQSYLERQVRTLERYYQDYQGLRQGNVALLRGQILASAVVRVPAPGQAPEAIDELLREANRTAIQQMNGSGEAEASQQVIQITSVEVEELTNQIGDGQDYVVRILSAGNYVRGETAVRVFADAVLNQVVFLAGEAIAATSINPVTMNDEQILERLDLLIESSKFRARRAGIFGSTIQIADGDPETLLRFVQQVKSSSQPLDIRAVASVATYTAGPLKLELVALQDNQVLFRTEQRDVRS